MLHPETIHSAEITELLATLENTATEIKATKRNILDQRILPINQITTHEAVKGLIHNLFSPNHSAEKPDAALYLDLQEFQEQLNTLLNFFPSDLLDNHVNGNPNLFTIQEYKPSLKRLLTFLENIGFATSGSAEHGFMHGGPLTVFKKNHLYPKIWSATSAGVIPLLKIITARGLDKVPDHTIDDITDEAGPLDFFQPNKPFKINQPLCDDHILNDFLQRHSTDPETGQLLTIGDIDPKDLKIYIICCDAETFERFPITNLNPNHHSIKLWEACRASCAWIPLFSKTALTFPENGGLTTKLLIDGNHRGSYAATEFQQANTDYMTASYANFFPDAIYHSPLPRELLIILQKMCVFPHALSEQEFSRAILKVVNKLPENVAINIILSLAAFIANAHKRSFFCMDHVFVPPNPGWLNFVTLGRTKEERLSNAHWLLAHGINTAESQIQQVLDDLPITQTIHNLRFGHNQDRDIYQEIALANTIRDN